ncbi:hypothetical protein KRR40_27175 [Niabella defluvii]|nr:hypothetical protein KRR40_27175 [Niabella sp. I65]
MKHTYDSIDTLDPIYENCTFKIVHPYLDDHSLHFKFSYGLLEYSFRWKIIRQRAWNQLGYLNWTLKSEPARELLNVIKHDWKLYIEYLQQLKKE